jgi:hypothetical protein
MALLAGEVSGLMLREMKAFFGFDLAAADWREIAVRLEAACCGCSLVLVCWSRLPERHLGRASSGRPGFRLMYLG